MGWLDYSLPPIRGPNGPMQPRSRREAVLMLLREASIPVTARELAHALGRESERDKIRVLLGRLAREGKVLCVGTLEVGDERNLGHPGNPGLWVAL